MVINTGGVGLHGYGPETTRDAPGAIAANAAGMLRGRGRMDRYGFASAWGRRDQRM